MHIFVKNGSTSNQDQNDQQCISPAEMVRFCDICLPVCHIPIILYILECDGNCNITVGQVIN